MKKLPLILFACLLFIFACENSKKSETKSDSTIKNMKTYSVDACNDKGTPFMALDVCKHAASIGIYNPDINDIWLQKNMMIWNDSSSLQIINKKITFDSIASMPALVGGTAYIIGVDPSGKNMGRLSQGVIVSNTAVLAALGGTPIVAGGTSRQIILGNGTYRADDYYNTVNTSGGAGQAVFYLTSDKTSSGTALYSTIDNVTPGVNNADLNYSFGWIYNSGTKALTVTAKAANGINVSLLGLTLLGTPQAAANGVPVLVTVKGH